MLLDLVDPISQFTQPCIVKAEMAGLRNFLLGTHPIRAVGSDEVDIDLEIVLEAVSLRVPATRMSSSSDVPGGPAHR